VSLLVIIVPTAETITLLMLLVRVPLASAKRPVPPVMVLTSVATLVLLGSNVPVPTAVAKISSPFAATMVAVCVQVNVLPVTVNPEKSLWKVDAPMCESWPLPSEIPVPVARSTVVVDVVLPLTGRSVPFAAPSAVAGLKAATASTKLERKISLRSGILATPFWVHARPCLRVNGSWYFVGQNGAEAERVGESIGADRRIRRPLFALIVTSCPGRSMGVLFVTTRRPSRRGSSALDEKQ
jgi:hypothetical protein